MGPWALTLATRRDTHVPVAFPWVTSLPCFFSFAWAKRYRATLMPERIRIGSFFFREIRYTDITHVRYYGFSLKGKYRIYSALSRWPITVYSEISDFASFVSEMKTIYIGPVAGGGGTQMYIPSSKKKGVRLINVQPLPQNGF